MHFSQPRVITVHFRARLTGTRINIQTQTVSLMKKASPLPKSAPAATTVVSNGSEDYGDAAAAAAAVAENSANNSSRVAVHAEQEDAADGDWRMQSQFLPPLGRASSGNSWTEKISLHIPLLNVKSRLQDFHL